jgi:hypothetical protein
MPDIDALIKLESLLAKAVEAGKADDMRVVEEAVKECDALVSSIAKFGMFDGNNTALTQNIKALYQAVECILADKSLTMRQQLQSVQQAHKLFDVYRP